MTGGDGRGLPLFPVTSRHLPSPPLRPPSPPVTTCHHLTSPRHFPYGGGGEVTGSDGGGNVVTGGDGRGLPLFFVTSRHLQSPPYRPPPPPLRPPSPPVTSCHHLTSPRHFPYAVGGEVTGSDGGGNVVTRGDERGLTLYLDTSRHLPSPLVTILPPPVTFRMWSVGR